VPAVKPFWKLLHRYGADLIVQAHGHSYERLMPLNPDGTTDTNGAGTRPNPILSFVAGTGSKNLKPNDDCGPLRPQSAKFLYDKLGVLALTLHVSSYDYEYVQTTDDTDAVIADSGVGVPVNP